MKKFTYLMAALSMVAVSANAQQISNDDFAAADFGGELVTIQNPSFEEFEGEDGTVLSAHAKGWEQESASAAWEGKSQKSMPENTHGAWYIRCLKTSGSLNAPARIYQTVTGKGAGVYVLSASVCVSRNGQAGNIDNLNNIFGYLYVVDNEDLDFVENPMEKALRIGECLATMPRKYVVYDAIDGASLEIGFGLPAESNGNPKGWLQCDAFKLEYVAGKTVAEVQALVEAKTTGISTIKTVADKNDGAIFNLAGQKVNDNFKGIAIQNGRKFIAK